MLRLIVTAVLIAFTGINTWFFTHKATLPDLQKISIQTQQTELNVYVELATTPQEKSLGLMHRTLLKEGRGMLFIYEKPQRVSFWMKNMLISIDMIFIGEDFIIKHISYGATPCLAGTQCAYYRPPVPVQYILEVPSGYAQKHQIKVGDTLTLNPENLND